MLILPRGSTASSAVSSSASDSATLANKGLELIEAQCLFGLRPAQCTAVLHPQSIVHCLVEFTDGANPWTIMTMRRFETMGGYRPYAGLGVGISLPHVEEERNGGVKTFGYQYGGPVLVGTGGVSYDLNDKWRLNTELQVHYLKLDVRVAGGRLKTNLVTNAINIGASYRF